MRVSPKPAWLPDLSQLTSQRSRQRPDQYTVSRKENVPNVFFSLSLIRLHPTKNVSYLQRNGLTTPNVCLSPSKCSLTLRRPLVRTATESLLWSFPQPNRDCIDWRGYYLRWRRRLFTSQFVSKRSSQQYYPLLAVARGKGHLRSVRKHRLQQSALFLFLPYPIRFFPRYFTDYMVFGQMKQ